MQFAYYPGCSLHATGREYDESTRAVAGRLGISLVELEGWVCCGASSAHSVSRELAVCLPAVNLAIAQSVAAGDVLAPCAACYNRTKAADHAMRTDPTMRRLAEEAACFSYTGEVRVRNPLEVMVEDVGLETIRAEVRRPIAGLRVVSYYGCLLVRPPSVMQFDDPEHPVMMDKILAAIGADVRRWSYATDCCGGSVSLPRADVARRLVTAIARHAAEAGAAAIVTACPLCQMNLEMRQATESRLPIFYFAELMGLAFEIPEAARWLRRHLIDTREVLRGVAGDFRWGIDD